MKMETRLRQLIMMNQEMFWNKVLIKKLKKANFLTIQHMIHKEMLKIIEKMRKYTDIKTENGATGQQLRMYDANGKLIE